MSAALGLIATAVAGREPGDLLGVFLIAGTLIAGIGVRAERVHVIIPAPALAFLAAGLIAGLIHDRGTDVTRTALAVSALQWIAAGFLAMTAATVLAIALTIVRRRRATVTGGRRLPARGLATRRPRGSPDSRGYPYSPGYPDSGGEDQWDTRDFS